MDNLRAVVNQIKSDEDRLLQTHIQQQQFYILYTPFLLIIATLISMFITGFAYVRIRRDMNDRLAQQEIEEGKYRKTAERIAVLEGVTHAIADGDYTCSKS